MKKIFTAILCMALIILPLSGCGIASRVLSALRNARGTPRPSPTIEQLTKPPAEPTKALMTPMPSEPAPQTAEPTNAAETPRPLKTVKPTGTPGPVATPTALSGNRNDISWDEAMEYFRQVVFGTEEDRLALKWSIPLVVSVSGDYNQDDMNLITKTYGSLNKYEGFPGAATDVDSDAKVNMQIKFVTAEKLASDEPNWSGKSPCYAAYWYDSCKIYQAVVYIVPDMENSRADEDCDLTWGVFYTLGMVNNSDMYCDSLFNPDYYGASLGDSYLGPCTADWSLVSMLYDKAIKPGMTFDQAKGALSE